MALQSRDKSGGTGRQVALPPYWEEAKVELMRRDRIMNKLIPQFGDLHLVGHDDPFTTLARSIVNQQVTPKAASAAWQKLLVAIPKFTPALVIKAGAEELSACGLSKRKTEYILDLADHFKARRVHADLWSQMDDEAVIAEAGAMMYMEDGIAMQTIFVMMKCELGRAYEVADAAVQTIDELIAHVTQRQ